MAEHTERQQTPSQEETPAVTEKHTVELRSDEVVERTEAPVAHVYSTPSPVVTAKKDTAHPHPAQKEEGEPHSEFSYLFSDEEGDPYDILMEQRKNGETHSGRRLGNALPVKEKTASSTPDKEESPLLFEEPEEEEIEQKSRFSVKQWLQNLFAGKNKDDEDEDDEGTVDPGAFSEPSQPEEDGTPDEIPVPAEDDTPVDISVPAEEDTPVDISVPAEGGTPVDVSLPAEDDTPVDISVPAEEDTPVDISAPAEDDTPVDISVPAEEDIPAELPTPAPSMEETQVDLFAQTPADVYFPPVTETTQELEQAQLAARLEKEAEEAEETEEPEEPTPEPPAVEEPPVPEKSPLRVEGVYVYNEETDTSRLVYDIEPLPAIPVAAEGTMNDLIAWEYQRVTAKVDTAEEAPAEDVPSFDLPAEEEEAHVLPTLPESKPARKSFPQKLTALLQQGMALLLTGMSKLTPDEKKEGEEDTEETSFREYEPDSNPDLLRKDMASLCKQLRLRLYVLAALFGITLLLAITNSLPFALPGFFKAGESSSFAHVLPNFLCMAIAMLFSINTLKNGWSGILNLRGESDGAISFASGICAFYMIYLMLNGRAISQGAFVPVPAVLLGLLLNTYGKYLIMKRTRNNFRFVTSSEEKYLLKLAEKELGQAALPRIQKEDVRPIYRQKTSFLKQFLRLSYAFDESEQTSQKWMVPGIIFTAVTTVLALIFSRDIMQGMMALSLSACISVPLTNMLSINFPVSRTAERLLRTGAMLPGYAAAEQLADANYILLRDTDLFPSHSVVFCVLRAFGYDRIDEAILDAAALIAEIKGPMKDMFETVLRDKADDLPKVESVHYEEGEGLVGWVHGSRVLVGNEKLLERHGISAPSKDYTEKYADANRSITYLAVSGELVAMFVSEYTANHVIADQLNKAAKAGLHFLVQTSDCNVTKELITQRFGLPANAVELLPQSQTAAWEKLQQETEGEEAGLTVSGKLSSLLQASYACRLLKNAATLAVLLQNVGLLLGMLLVLFLAVTSAVTAMGTLYLLIFQAFWILAVLGVPYLRRFFHK